MQWKLGTSQDYLLNESNDFQQSLEMTKKLFMPIYMGINNMYY